MLGAPATSPGLMRPLRLYRSPVAPVPPSHEGKAQCFDLWDVIGDQITAFLKPYPMNAASAVVVAKKAVSSSELSLTGAEAALESAGLTLEDSREDAQRAEADLSKAQSAAVQAAKDIGKSRALLQGARKMNQHTQELSADLVCKTTGWNQVSRGSKVCLRRPRAIEM